MGQNWATSDEGGYLANPELSSKLRHAAQPMMRFQQFVRQEPGAPGKGQGDTLDFNKIKNIETAASLDGLDEQQTMPESKFKIERGQLTVTEYGNSVPYTGKLEYLSEFDLTNPVQRVLRDDQAKTRDALMARYFKNHGVSFVSTGASTGTFTTNGTPSGLATNNLSIDHVETIRDYLKEELLTEPYDGENYVCLASVRALRGLKGDSKWREAALYGDPDRLFRGEVGMYEGIRFIEVNHDGALGRLGIAGEAEYAFGEAVFFGADVCIEGVVCPPELRAKIPGDYGRSKGVAWYSLEGWTNPWNYTSDAEARAVWFTSTSCPLGPPGWTRATGT